jgi:hypothetical protein
VVSERRESAAVAGIEHDRTGAIALGSSEAGDAVHRIKLSLG